MVVEDVRTVCPDITDLMQKLQGKAGSKFFSVVTSSQQPAALLINLYARILPHKQEPVSAALSLHCAISSGTDSHS